MNSQNWDGGYFVLAVREWGLQLKVVNLPNILTLSRIPMVFVILAILHVPLTGFASLALVCFLLGGLTDWLDGYLARQSGLVSDFGKLMDALTDKVFIIGLLITLLAIDLIPVSWGLPFILLILSREFLITGLRLVAVNKGVVLAAEQSGKLKTVVQILAVSFLLLGHALEVDYGLMDTGALIANLGLVCFVLATALTVYSGSKYIKKHWGLFIGE
jgi:CDP-diacylglycerol--glycerol-3-phosphate 3-phosphatidyltransferase